MEYEYIKEFIKNCDYKYSKVDAGSQDLIYAVQKILKYNKDEKLNIVLDEFIGKYVDYSKRGDNQPDNYPYNSYNDFSSIDGMINTHIFGKHSGNYSNYPVISKHNESTHELRISASSVPKPLKDKIIEIGEIFSQKEKELKRQEQIREMTSEEKQMLEYLDEFTK